MRCAKRSIPSLMLVLYLAAPLRVAAQEAVTTLAGSVLQSGGADGPAASALFGDPTGLAMDANGNIYIADNQSNTIRVLSAAGIVSTLAGRSGQAGSADGTGANAYFFNPSGIVLAPNGNLYVTDTGNDTIRCVTTGGVVTTIAGSAGQLGATNASGSLARFSSPLGITVDSSGVLCVADSGNHLIRKVTTGGTASTFAGTAGVWGTNDGAVTSALFNGPVGVAYDSAGNLFVSDSVNHTIRKISGGQVTTWAGKAGVDGTADGVGGAARFGKPAEMKMDRNNNLFVVDSFYHTIRMITPGAAVTTVAGLGGNGGSANGFGSQARFFNPYGLAIDHNGNLRVSDTYNETIRFIYTPIPVSLAKNAAGGFVITWQAVPNDTYQVQYRDVGAGVTWQNLGGLVTPTTSIGTATDGSPASNHRLYRVKLMP